MPNSVDPAVKELAEKTSQQGSLYITEHSVPHGFDFPENSPVDAVPGLLFYEVIVKTGQKGHVIAWWKSREAFEASTERFAKLLGSNAVLSFQGFQVPHRARRNLLGRALKPAAIVAVVSGIVALLTGLSTIQDWVYSMLAIPNCTVWIDPEAAAKPKASGEPFAIQIQIKNRHLRASSTAIITPVLKGNGLKLADDIDSYTVRVEPGKAEVQEFRFIASHGGHYDVSFEGKQKAGSVMRWREIPPLKKTIDVWDSLDQSPQVSLVKSTDRSASVAVEVHNAKPTPYGMAFEATLTTPGEVDIRADKRSIQHAEDPLRNADFALLRWVIPRSADVLTAQTLRLVLQEAGATTRSADEWKQLLKRLSVHADEPDELSSSEDQK
jgi:hypothetical protein